MSLISRVGDLGILLVVVIFLSQGVSLVIVLAEVSTFFELFQNDIIGEEYDNCSLAVSLHSILCL